MLLKNKYLAQWGSVPASGKTIGVAASLLSPRTLPPLPLIALTMFSVEVSKTRRLSSAMGLATADGRAHEYSTAVSIETVVPKFAAVRMGTDPAAAVLILVKTAFPTGDSAILLRSRKERQPTSTNPPPSSPTHR